MVVQMRRTSGVYFLDERPKSLITGGKSYESQVADV